MLAYRSEHRLTVRGGWHGLGANAANTGYRIGRASCEEEQTLHPADAPVSPSCRLWTTNPMKEVPTSSVHHENLEIGGTGRRPLDGVEGSAASSSVWRRCPPVSSERPR